MPRPPAAVDISVQMDQYKTSCGSQDLAFVPQVHYLSLLYDGTFPGAIVRNYCRPPAFALSASEPFPSAVAPRHALSRARPRHVRQPKRRAQGLRQRRRRPDRPVRLPQDARASRVLAGWRGALGGVEGRAGGERRASGERRRLRRHRRRRGDERHGWLRGGGHRHEREAGADGRDEGGRRTRLRLPERSARGRGLAGSEVADRRGGRAGAGHARRHLLIDGRHRP